MNPILILLSLLSGVFYSLGGVGGGKWYFDTKMRDIGCTTILLLSLWLLGFTAPIWVWIVTAGLQWASLTTYYKFGKQKDVKWYNWLLTGVVTAFAIIPFVIFGNVTWLEFLLRIFVLGISTMVWSELVSHARAEEFGRGFLLNITLLLLR